MNILLLTCRIPYPLNDGGNIAVYNMIEGLMEQGHTVSLLSMNTSKHWVDVQQLTQRFSQLQHFKTVPVDNKVQPMAALKSLILNESYNIKRFINPNYKTQLNQLLKEHSFDLVIMEGLYVTPYLDTIKSYIQLEKIVYRQHNIEFNIWSELAETSRHFLKKAYLNILAKQLKSYEVEFLKSIKTILPISTSEHIENLKINKHLNSYPIPIGIEMAEEKRQQEQLPYSVYHIGAMDWLPNQYGVKWFINEVWEKVIEAIPEAHFYFAGRNMPEEFQQFNTSSITCLGEVANAQEFSADKSVLIVPIHAACGIRIKTLEALAQGKVVVTTKMGANGLDVKDNTHLLIRNSGTDFAKGIIDVLKNDQLYQNLSNSAQKHISKTYNKQIIYSQLSKFLKQLS